MSSSTKPAPDNAPQYALLRKPTPGVTLKVGQKAARMVVSLNPEFCMAGPSRQEEVNVVLEGMESSGLGTGDENAKVPTLELLEGKKDNGKENFDCDEEDDEYSDKPGEKLVMPSEPKVLNKVEDCTKPKNSGEPEGLESKMSAAMAFFTSDPIPEESNMNAFNADALNEKGLLKEKGNDYDNQFRGPSVLPPKLTPYPFTKFFFDEYNKMDDKEPLKKELEPTMDNVSLEWEEMVEVPSQTLAWNVFVDTWNWVKYGTYGDK